MFRSCFAVTLLLIREVGSEACVATSLQTPYLIGASHDSVTKWLLSETMKLQIGHSMKSCDGQCKDS